MIDDLPNDVIEKIRRIYFEAYVKPKMMDAFEWLPVVGCERHFQQPASFVLRVANWTRFYLDSFFPVVARVEPDARGGAAYREYIATNKLCWVNVVEICVDDFGTFEICEIMTSIKRWFQQLYEVVQVRGRRIRLILGHNELKSVDFAIRNGNIDANEKQLEWKPLMLKIDFSKNLAYFEDPSDGRKSRFVMDDNSERSSHYRATRLLQKDWIPWLVYLP